MSAYMCVSMNVYVCVCVMSNKCVFQSKIIAYHVITRRNLYLKHYDIRISQSEKHNEVSFQ